MKRRFTLLLALFLFLSSFSFGATTPGDAGLKLKELGIIQGDEKGNLNEDQNVTREEAIVTLTRMMGKEGAAKLLSSKPSFTDVPVGHWAMSCITYAEAEGWTKGIGAGKFGLGESVTTQEYVTFMLRALGYTGADVYEKAMTMGQEMGLLKDVTATQAKDIIKRGDVFTLMHHTLYTNPKDKDQALVYELGLLKKEKSSEKTEEIKETAYPFEIQNYNGKPLVLQEKPKKIASLILGTDELLLGLVEESRIVGLSGQIGNQASASLAAEKAAKFPKMENNFEVILKQQPDLIIGSSWIKKELLAQIEDSKINYYGYKSPNTIAEQIQVIENFSALLGENKKGQAIIDDWHKRMAVIQEKAKTIKEDKKLTVLPYSMHNQTNAKGTIVDEIIYMVGAKNAATEAGLEKRAKLSKEKLIEINPDVILVMAWGKDDLEEFNQFIADMKKDPSLKSLKAVKNNRIIVEDGRYMTIVTQHLIEGIEFVAKSIYPEVYGK